MNPKKWKVFFIVPAKWDFFEEVIFKKKDIPKFINLINAKAMKISTINPFSCDDLIKTQLDKIESKMI